VSRSAFDEGALTVSPDEVNVFRRRIRVRDSAVIIYTSGTTSNPKGCILSHEALTRGPVERAATRFVSADPHVSWAGGPMFHIGAMAPMIGALGAGGTYLNDIYFDAGRAIALMEQEQPTTAWPWFPGPMQQLLNHPDFDATRLSSVRYMLLIGPPVLISSVQALFPGAELVAACGMTETAGIYALSDTTETVEERATAQGKAAPGIEVKIVDPLTGEEQPDNVPGEILVRGYCVTEGYYNAPEMTAQAIDAEQWLHTGDLYSRTETGCLRFSGRIKDMLKVGGENVAALEIESFLCEHPSVLMAAVIGKPDSILDEVPVAFVELREGHTLDRSELIEFCEGRISRYKIPREVHFISGPEWPMSATKVNKRGLRRILNSSVGSGSGI
jgi:fatty-acyl-CoA synthase/long-chain acyl-CoA synthetase